jgi:hypothetical protein
VEFLLAFFALIEELIRFSTATPQPIKHEDFHHEGREEQEVRSFEHPNPLCPS